MYNSLEDTSILKSISKSLMFPFLCVPLSGRYVHFKVNKQQSNISLFSAYHSLESTYILKSISNNLLFLSAPSNIPRFFLFSLCSDLHIDIVFLTSSEHSNSFLTYSNLNIRLIFEFQILYVSNTEQNSNILLKHLKFYFKKLRN